MKCLCVILLLSLASLPAAALTATEKCQADKLKTAGRYDQCLFKETARAARNGGQLDGGKCAAHFSITWNAIEAAAGGACASNGDAAAVQAFVAQNSDDVATAVAGGDLPDCGQSLAACESAASTCEGDLASCSAVPRGQSGATGQTNCTDSSGALVACQGTGEDGETQAGLPSSFTDNGDGTITDNRSGLMWEKLSRDGSIHDADTIFTWAAATATKITLFNLAQFAGHADWRLPNVNELRSLADYGRANPAIDAAFDRNCVPGCAMAACSCAQADDYWTSSSYQAAPAQAWTVWFADGALHASPKTQSHYVRAVRGGS